MDGNFSLRNPINAAINPKIAIQKPEKVIELAVKRMLPKNKLGTAMLRKLKVYRGSEHEHHAQKPEKIELF